MKLLLEFKLKSNKLYNLIITIAILFQCLIGDGETIVLCILKCSDMIKQVNRAMSENEMVKITIENFQKRDGILFTSEKSSIEIDTEVFSSQKLYRFKTSTVMC